MSAGTPLLAARGLSVRYGNAVALDEVELDLRRGEMLTVLGANGAGKSTLASALSGLVPVSAGTITFDGDDVTKLSAHRRARLGIAHVPELRGIFPGLSVADNVKAGFLRLSRFQRHEALERAFSTFPVLAERRNQAAGTLSGGERQMLALARVLADPPRLLIADEMSLGLAPRLVSEVFDGIRAAQAAGAAVLLIEQFVDRALALADRALILRRGSVAWTGVTSDVDPHALGRLLGLGGDLEVSAR